MGIVLSVARTGVQTLKSREMGRLPPAHFKMLCRHTPRDSAGGKDPQSSLSDERAILQHGFAGWLCTHAQGQADCHICGLGRNFLPSQTGRNLGFFHLPLHLEPQVTCSDQLGMSDLIISLSFTRALAIVLCLWHIIAQCPAGCNTSV